MFHLASLEFTVAMRSQRPSFTRAIELSEKVLGIEDLITLNQNKQTYHLSSVDNANTLQLSLNIQTTLGDIFKNFAESPTLGDDERGLVKTLLTSSLNPRMRQFGSQL